MTPDELLNGLDRAAKANHQAEFDRLERDLLNRFEGGFAGMPRKIYERYLEVDRSWPVRTDAGPVGGDAASSGRLGPLLPINARIPDVLLEWLIALGAETGRSRSEVLTLCLDAIRRDPSLEARLRRALSLRKD